MLETIKLTNKDEIKITSDFTVQYERDKYIQLRLCKSKASDN